jgi:hypothetical protein
MNVNGSHASNITPAGAGITTIVMTFGPRYTWMPRRRKFEVFGEGLFGDARGTHSVFPTSPGTVSDIDAFALQVGGGVNLHTSGRFSIRPLQADWVRTQFPSETTNVQNSLRLSTGVVVKVP